MIVGKLLTGYLSDIVGPGRAWLGTGPNAAGCLPPVIYAATPTP
jgi:hypothetical protein